MRQFIGLLIIILTLAACGSAPPADVSDRNAPPSAATAAVSATQPAANPPAVVGEGFFSLQTTHSAAFMLVTPTPPPSKTPSPAAPVSAVPPVNAREAIASPPPAVPARILPTVILPTGAPPSVVTTCAIPWTFPNPPAGCPAAPSTVHIAAFQSFEQAGYASYMLWIEPRAVFVLYGDGQSPHWREYVDTFVEGEDPSYEPGLDYSPEFAPERPSMDRWQPRRGFGKLWRDNVTPLDIKARIGWADIEYEIAYTMIVQSGQDGLLYFSDPYGRVFGLPPGGGRWTLTAVSGGGQSANPPVLPPP